MTNYDIIKLEVNSNKYKCNACAMHIVHAYKEHVLYNTKYIHC